MKNNNNIFIGIIVVIIFIILLMVGLSELSSLAEINSRSQQQIEHSSRKKFQSKISISDSVNKFLVIFLALVSDHYLDLI